MLQKELNVLSNLSLQAFLAWFQVSFVLSLEKHFVTRLKPFFGQLPMIGTPKNKIELIKVWYTVIKNIF